MLTYNFLNKKISKKNFNKKFKKNQNIKIVKKKITMQNYLIHMPSNWDYIMIKNLNTDSYLIFLYSNIYYFYIPLTDTKFFIKIDKNSRVVKVTTPNVNYGSNLYLSFMNKLFKSFSRPFFRKVKFKGKGYYIFKNFRQTITPQFGHSHRIYVYSYYASVIFLSKTSILIFGLKHYDVFTSASLIKKMRPINIFTGRGVRFNKQIIYKKTGKVSSYR